MKKVLLSALLGVCGVLPLCAAGEPVGAVYFNPSRLGEYTYLKVQNRASFKGGLSISNTLSFKGQKPIDVEGKISGGAEMNIGNVVGNTNASVLMPEATFGNNNTIATVSGGNLKMVGPDNTITTVRSTGDLDIDASYTDVQTITVDGSLMLDGVKIETPSECHAHYYWKELNNRQGQHAKVLAMTPAAVHPCGGEQLTASCSWVDGKGDVEGCWVETQTGAAETGYRYECYIPQRGYTYSSIKSFGEFYWIAESNLPVPELQAMGLSDGKDDEGFCGKLYENWDEVLPDSITPGATCSEALSGRNGWAYAESIEPKNGGFLRRECNIYTCHCDYSYQ